MVIYLSKLEGHKKEYIDVCDLSRLYNPFIRGCQLFLTRTKAVLLSNRKFGLLLFSLDIGFREPNLICLNTSCLFPLKQNFFTKEVFKMLKSTGIVRQVDELGRITLPIELRRTLEINEKDSLEIFVEGNTIVLKKYEPSCMFCGNARNVISYKDRNICSDCLEELKNFNA